MDVTMSQQFTCFLGGTKLLPDENVYKITDEVVIKGHCRHNLLYKLGTHLAHALPLFIPVYLREV